MPGKEVVLWISRHKPLQAQMCYLRERLGDFELIQYDKPISDAIDVVNLVRKYDAKYVVPVLPLKFLIDLVEYSKKMGFKILRADMAVLHNCDNENCPDFNEETDNIMISVDKNTGDVVRRHFRFRKFEVLKDIKIVTETF